MFVIGATRQSALLACRYNRGSYSDCCTYFPKSKVALNAHFTCLQQLDRESRPVQAVFPDVSLRC